MMLRSTASPRVGTLVLAFLSTLVGNVGAQYSRCDNFRGTLKVPCSAPCDNEYTIGSIGSRSFYKTNVVNGDCSCNGNEFPVYQRYSTAGAHNQFLYYKCATKKWGTAVTSGTDQFNPSTLPSHDTTYDEMTGCPVNGASCSASSGPAPSGPAPSGPAPSGPAPSGPAPSGPAPAGPASTSVTAVTCGDDDNICAPMAGFLPGICSCSGTNGGTGSFTECSKSWTLGIAPVSVDLSVGIRVELEPCDCGGAYAAVSYKAGSDWKSAGRLAAGETNSFAIPGFSFQGAGLYADVAISGDKSRLVVDVHLSLCNGGKCNGAVDEIGWLISKAGFPTAIIKDFEGVDFTEQCKCAPDCSSESSSPGIGMIIGIVIGAVVVVLVIAGGVGVAMHMKKKKAASAAAGGKAQGGVALTTPSAAPLPDATPVETKV